MYHDDEEVKVKDPYNYVEKLKKSNRNLKKNIENDLNSILNLSSPKLTSKLTEENYKSEKYDFGISDWFGDVFNNITWYLGLSK